ncbi:hypothetical protein RND71_014122 [Anisodus tanguticus]|uniref:Uncharacterized protein n=1 Tax=Anisodus tanguticus TaxID=243964 RepID=A0AAE1SB98_9SOLA|nr:hypothetical protein RND71_014122 [Anisodus tanguticus]
MKHAKFISLAPIMTTKCTFLLLCVTFSLANSQDPNTGLLCISDCSTCPVICSPPPSPIKLKPPPSPSPSTSLLQTPPPPPPPLFAPLRPSPPQSSSSHSQSSPSSSSHKSPPPYYMIYTGAPPPPSRPSNCPTPPNPPNIIPITQWRRQPLFQRVFQRFGVVLPPSPLLSRKPLYKIVDKGVER